MASVALQGWQTRRAAVLDALDGECAAAAGRQPPDPVLEDALVRGYVLLLAAQLQGFSRDLYTEGAMAVVRAVPLAAQPLVQTQCEARRELVGGSARYQSIRTDFERFNLNLRAALAAHDPAADGWTTDLDRMNAWRNFVAHDNTQPPAHGGPLTLLAVRGWRATCDRMAGALDAVVYDHLRGLVGTPW